MLLNDDNERYSLSKVINHPFFRGPVPTNTNYFATMSARKLELEELELSEEEERDPSVLAESTCDDLFSMDASSDPNSLSNDSPKAL